MPKVFSGIRRPRKDLVEYEVSRGDLRLHHWPNPLNFMGRILERIGVVHNTDRGDAQPEAAYYEDNNIQVVVRKE